jgi:hypothetical protein
MRLTPKELLFLFAIGAAGGLVGDAGNVQSGVTRYLDDSVPFIWESALWFPLLVGLATAATGELRLRLAPPRPGFDLRQGLGAIAAVVGIYALTSIVGDDGTESVALLAALAVLTACVLADGRAAIICGLAAAIGGPLAEIAIVELEWSEYSASNDRLLGVALWLIPLYFAFGVAVARIAEVLVARRQPSRS